MLKRVTNTEEFINRAQTIHGNKYDYSLVRYVRSNQKIKEPWNFEDHAVEDGMFLQDVQIDEITSKKVGKTVYLLVIERKEAKANTPDSVPAKPELPIEGPQPPQPPQQDGATAFFESLSDRKKYDFPDRKYLEIGDICILFNAARLIPLTYARIEHIAASKIIGQKIVGILQLIPGRASYFSADVPLDCIKIEDAAGFSGKAAPFPLLLKYFPMLKKQTILTPPKPGEGMFRQGAHR